ncbi:MAG: tyrosine--tRNA ligase [Gemmatimonadaceae bacterium]
MTIHASFLSELAWRGLLYQQTEGSDAALGSGPVTGYCGFDPTAPSLHVGNLVPVMGLVHLQRGGHRPIVLVGGGTGMIGDPSGRSSERPLADEATIEANSQGIRGQLEQFLDFSGSRGALMRNNAAWLTSLGLIAFLRDVGKHFSINLMLAKDSVRSRLETGITYTEFSYMLLQAYDFAELCRTEGATLQIGGSDQWGNITAGTELIRRTLGKEAHGVTLPLVTNSDGKKFGKSEGGNIWLDPERTSPYQFYQFWINTDDRDAGRNLRYFTLKPRAEIEGLEQSLAQAPEGREAQQALAMDVTARVHGEEAARTARDVSRILFDKRADPRDLNAQALRAIEREVPFATVPVVGAAEGAAEPALDVVDGLVRLGMVKSKSDARRQLQQGAVSVNGRRLTTDEGAVPLGEALHGTYFLLRKGSRDVGLLRTELHPR